TVAPDAFPVTATEVREHLRLGDADADSFIEMLIGAAVDHAEDAMSIALMPRTISATFYNGEPLILPRGPVLEMLRVTNANGDDVVGCGLKHVGNQAQIVAAWAH